MNRVLLIAGQSNALGCAPNPISDAAVAAYTAQRTRIWVAGSGWQLLEPYNIAQTQCDASQHGIEQYFAYLFEQKFPDDDLYIIKRARGGSVLAQDGATQDWHPASGELFSSFCSYLDAALGSDELTSYSPLGFYWMQGETDCHNLTYANAYAANLAGFFSSLHSTVPATKNFHKYIGRVKESAFWTYRNQIRTAQENICAVPGDYTIVDTDEVPTFDGSHYTSSGNYSLAKQMFRRMSCEESGLWTPTLLGDISNPSVEFGSRQGVWGRSGKLVKCSFQIEITSISGGSGNALLGGLPFSPVGRLPGMLNTFAVNFLPGRTQLYMDGSTRYTKPYFMSCGSGQWWGAVPLSNIPSGSWLTGSMDFITN